MSADPRKPHFEPSDQVTCSGYVAIRFFSGEALRLPEMQVPLCTCPSQEVAVLELLFKACRLSRSLIGVSLISHPSLPIADELSCSKTASGGIQLRDPALMGLS